MATTTKKKTPKQPARVSRSAARQGRAGQRAAPALPPIDPFAEVQEFPAWFREQFPAYAVPHHHDGPVKTVRAVNHGGHAVKITTTYEVEIDGRPLRLHLAVDQEGNLWSHSCPYRSFTSAVDLVKHLIDQLPEAFAAGGHHGGGHGGGGHH